MIFLIDDNISRQNGFGWNKLRFEEFSDIVCVINNIDMLFKNKESINKTASHIFIHESFKDLSALNNKSFIDDFIKEINYKAENKEIFLTFFSGGKNERSIIDNIVNIPADIFYQNLNIFLLKYSKKIDEIKHIVYGENIQIEENIIELLRTKNNNIDNALSIENSSKNLIFKSFEHEIEDPFEDTFSEIIYEDEDGITDTFLNKLCFQTLNSNEFENIFLPLCFGPTLSDFNGLRLATHIRCTPTINQLKPIFIYSVVDFKDIFNNEYVNILKTKNVYLIDYSKVAFKKALEIGINNFTIEELPIEIKKLNLKIPTNYEDNHSVANEWAIYRWSQAIDANDDGIKKIIDIQNSNLYFKYLKTIYPICHLDKINSTQLKIRYDDHPKVLYIDDEAEKGWYEIFCKILDDENKLFFRHLDYEFNEKSKEEIIDISLKKIIDEDIDLVILDFRLHKDDFENNTIEEVTGYKILKKIKEYNKGIQVIIFSATNKIWNLQALQTAGADGFVIKVSPENNTYTQFTKQSIQSFISITEECLNKRFLKYIFKTCEEIKKNINNTYSDPHSVFDEFKKEILVSLKIIEESANKIDLNMSSSLDVVFLNCYNFLEKFKLHYLKEAGGVVVLGFDEIEVKRYSFNGRLNDEGIFIRNNIYDNPSFFQAIISILVEYFAIVNANDNAITKVHEIKEARNNYIHGSKSNFEIDELTDIITICKIITINLKD